MSTHPAQFVILILFLSRVDLALASPPAERPDLDRRIIDAGPQDSTGAIAELRAMFAANPRAFVDQLNRKYMSCLYSGRHYAAIDEFAIAGSIAVARDTWPIEQLQRYRVRALRAAGKKQEALSAAKALFNVSGIGSTQYVIQELCICLKEVYPQDPGIVYRFKLQQLAGAQPTAEARRKAWEELRGLGDGAAPADAPDANPTGEPPVPRQTAARNATPTGELPVPRSTMGTSPVPGRTASPQGDILASIEIDPKPYEQAIEKLRGRNDYDSLYGLGNLLLLSGRATEAREVFERIVKIAPPKEIPYATEGLAKAIKAEDGAVGRANQFILSVRPAR
jgi:tetratricopeptide (TPR) repeat protein